MKRRFFMMALALLLAVTVLPVAAVPTASYAGEEQPAGVTTVADTTATLSTTVTSTTVTQPREPPTADPLRPKNRLWLVLIPVAAAMVLVATARPWKRK